VVWLIIAYVLVLLGLMGATFLLGFRLGGEHWHNELLKVRVQATQAERQLHDLTRAAFVAMTEHVEERRQQR
jgi:flagellar basal body-associated protein FliL